MPATVNVNMRSVVHASSTGITTAFPDVCKTPTPAGPIPIPYPNISQSSDTSKGSSTVKCDGQPIMLQDAEFKMSTGDEAGSAGGNVVTNKIKGPSTFMMFSFDVKIDGKPVPRQLDIMVANCMSKTPGTPPMPCMQPGGAAPPMAADKSEDTGIVSVDWDGD